jgi:mannose-6-phosphate isomerase-like protein (cupin superfamily)
MRIVKKPWGHEEIWAETDKYLGKILYIKSGHRLSLQYHERKTETVRVLSGRLLLVIQDRRDGPIFNKTLSEGDVYHVTCGTIHRFCAPEGDVELLEVSTPEIEDVVRLEDDYTRTTL